MPATAEQTAFVAHDPKLHGRALAGPGTGKSYTSVLYLERLAREHPELRTRMLTFTRAATAEFAAKMGDAELAGLGASPPATVHSFALSILMRTKGVSLPMPLRIPDSWETSNLIRPHLSRLLKRAGHTPATPTVVKRLEREMSSGWESLDPDRELYSDRNPALGAAYVGTWQHHRRIFGYVLIGELPYQAGIALEDHGTGAVELDVLLVDEYQDLNEADIKLIRLVAASGVAVLAIGDDDQSIYRFRMAAPQGIRRFLDEFSADCDYPLTESRRCGSEILAAARALIESAPDRPVKPALHPAAGVAPGHYAYLRFPSNSAEIKGVARIIKDRLDSGVAPGQVAVLVRSNLDYWSGALRPELQPYGIELASTDWVADAIAEPEVRRGIALGQLALRREDSLAWWGLLHLTPRVGPVFIDYIYEAAGNGESFGAALLRLHADGFPGGPSGAALASSTIDAALTTLTSLDIENAVIDARGWGGWLLDRLDRAALSEDAVRLFDAVGGAVPAGEGIQGFLANLEPLGKDLAANAADGVRAMTMTQSKGLTINTAIVLGVEDGIIPLPPPKGEINEERRLLYVAMTRATDTCILTYAARRTGQSARFGSPRVNRSRNRCPLLANLPGGVGNPQNGTTYVAALDGDVAT